MVATTSHSMKPLVTQLQRNHPEITFVEGKDFRWSPDERTVYYAPVAPDAPAYLLHETAHAMLGHAAYASDIELVAIERDAWQYALHQLAPAHTIQIDEDLIQNALDTYRDWLHARSTCPVCASAGMQVKSSTYQCVGCLSSWRVNEARQCGLKRYLKK